MPYTTNPCTTRPIRRGAKSMASNCGSTPSGRTRRASGRRVGTLNGSSSTLRAAISAREKPHVATPAIRNASRSGKPASDRVTRKNTSTEAMSSRTPKLVPTASTANDSRYCACARTAARSRCAYVLTTLHHQASGTEPLDVPRNRQHDAGPGELPEHQPGGRRTLDQDVGRRLDEPRERGDRPEDPGEPTGQERQREDQAGQRVRGQGPGDPRSARVEQPVGGRLGDVPAAEADQRR